MKPEKSLTEVHNYLGYISDSLYAMSRTYLIDKQDRIILERYAEDLSAYSKKIEELKNNMVAKEKVKQQTSQTLSELEFRYQSQKRLVESMRVADAAAKNNLKEILKSGTEKDILKAKDYVAQIGKQYITAKKNEDIMKREFEQGVL